MNVSYLIRIRNFVLLALAQALIFSRIHLFGYATAYILLIFLMKLPRYTSRNELLIWGFLLGAVVDIFGNTPGMNTAAMTAVAFMRNVLLEAVVPKSNSDDFVPGVRSINWGGYMGYSFICTLIYCALLYMIELFTINYPLPLLLSIVASTLLTMFIVVIIECFGRK